jgi:hypothetical protein
MHESKVVSRILHTESAIHVSRCGVLSQRKFRHRAQLPEVHSLLLPKHQRSILYALFRQQISTCKHISTRPNEHTLDRQGRSLKMEASTLIFSAILKRLHLLSTDTNVCTTAKPKRHTLVIIGSQAGVHYMKYADHKAEQTQTRTITLSTSCARRSMDVRIDNVPTTVAEHRLR